MQIEGPAGVLSARVCILACGVGYGLQRQLGLELPSLFLHSAQIEVDTRDGLLHGRALLGREVAPRASAGRCR